MASRQPEQTVSGQPVPVVVRGFRQGRGTQTPNLVARLADPKVRPAGASGVQALTELFSTEKSHIACVSWELHVNVFKLSAQTISG